jgi:hypothetical protein
MAMEGWIWLGRFTPFLSFSFFLLGWYPLDGLGRNCVCWPVALRVVVGVVACEIVIAHRAVLVRTVE